MLINHTDSSRCAFASKGIENSYYGCKILYVRHCDGLDTKCAFYKTKSRIIQESDRSIDRHRALDMCHNCKYHSVPCKKSNEV